MGILDTYGLWPADFFQEMSMDQGPRVDGRHRLLAASGGCWRSPLYSTGGGPSLAV